MIRVGNGFDLHRLVAGRPLILGGVHIPFELGTEGFSDGDPLIHAIIDSLLGAAGMGDIGMMFPSGAPEYAGVASTNLLKHVSLELGHHRYKIINIDSTILCEAPKLSPFFSAMKEQLATSLSTDASKLNVKATTTEKLGEIGKGNAVAAIACALVESY